MSFTIKHNIPTKKLIGEWDIYEFKGKFHIDISKKDVFNLSFDFNICYEWSNGIYENEYIKKSVKFTYIDKENTTDILDDLCAGLYEKEFEDEFKNQWIDGIRMNSIITNVVFQLDIWNKNCEKN